jgi:mannose-6-phosphate isomerase
MSTVERAGGSVEPIELEPNFVQRFYRGGEGIARLRGVAQPNAYVPEDWLGSATSVWDDATAGITRLPDGRLLSDAFAADPGGWFGAAHVARHGASPALLVKLLDGQQRLPVHYHPSREFAQRHLGSPFGKTEAWYVAGTADGGGTVQLGFREEVDAATVLRWVERQDVDAMLGALVPMQVAVGDTIFVPAGIPHAIGEDVLILELQEPTDLSVLMEWRDYEVDGAAEGHLGLGFATALTALDCSAMTPERLATLVSRGVERETHRGIARLFPEASRPFFRAESIVVDGDDVELPAELSILLALDGSGTLRTPAGASLELRRGSVVLVPARAGCCTLAGDVRVVRSMPSA